MKTILIMAAFTGLFAPNYSYAGFFDYTINDAWADIKTQALKIKEKVASTYDESNVSADESPDHNVPSTKQEATKKLNNDSHHCVEFRDNDCFKVKWAGFNSYSGFCLLENGQIAKFKLAKKIISAKLTMERYNSIDDFYREQSVCKGATISKDSLKEEEMENSRNSLLESQSNLIPASKETENSHTIRLVEAYGLYHLLRGSSGSTALNESTAYRNKPTSSSFSGSSRFGGARNVGSTRSGGKR